MSAFILILSFALFGARVDTVKVTENDYRVYRSDGSPATLDDISEAMKSVDVVFVGESHNDPVVHSLQLRILHMAHHLQMHENGRRLALSMEMFTKDNQYIVDEYLSDVITEKQFRAASQPWQNYETDYRPLVEFAKKHDLSVVAANAPRRYANRVSRFGRESLKDLSDQARSYLAPLPYGMPSEEYTEQWNKVMEESMAEMMAASSDADSVGTGSGEDGDENEGIMPDEDAMHEKAAMPDTDAMPEKGGVDADSTMAKPAMGAMPHGMGHMLDSQSLWDATMAYSVADYLTRHPSSLVVHVVGGFHVQTGTGIPEHLERYRPGTRRLIVLVEPVDDIDAFDSEEHAGLGDFVILSSNALPRTFDAGD